MSGYKIEEETSDSEKHDLKAEKGLATEINEPLDEGKYF